MFIEYLPCAKHCSSRGDRAVNEPDKTLGPLGVSVLEDSGLTALSPHKNMGPLLP